TELERAVQDIRTAMDRVKAANASGDFAELGSAYKALDDALKRFDAADGSTPPQSSAVQPSPTPTG
ncbi:hypothetical protein K7G98_41460, partial [Saccharothrix sp. MB29]|nr:hypothetical protein [Saccharothrix sp. MB29]